MRKIMFLLLCLMISLITPRAHADSTVVSDSTRYTLHLRHDPQVILPLRETVFWADLVQTADGAPVTEFTPVSQRRNPATGQNEWVDTDGNAVTTGKTVSTHLWMQMGDHGHGASATETRAEPRGSHHLIVRKAFFSMPGRWQLIFTFKNGADVLDRAVVPCML